MGSIKARITIRGSRELIDGLGKAFSPDNKITPDYMSMREETSREEYRVTIETPLNPRYVMSVMQTVDEILGLATAILRIYRSLRRGEKG